MNRRFAVEAFKFGVYLAIPVFAYAYFNDPDRVARFVKRVRIIYRLNTAVCCTPVFWEYRSLKQTVSLSFLLWGHVNLFTLNILCYHMVVVTATMIVINHCSQIVSVALTPTTHSGWYSSSPNHRHRLRSGIQYPGILLRDLPVVRIQTI